MKKQYFNGYGKIKTAISTVKLFPNQSKNNLIINKLDIQSYIKNDYIYNEFIYKFNNLLNNVNLLEYFDFICTVRSGGIISQMEATLFAIAKAFLNYAELNLSNSQFLEIKSIIRKQGLATIVNKIKQRKTAGKPKARRSRQFSKR